MPNYDLIAILGPTASGRTSFTTPKRRITVLCRNSEAI